MPKTLNVCFPGVDAQTLVLLLDSNGVYVSAGSACTAHENIPSRTLTAMGLSEEDARSSIRISLSTLTTLEEIDRAANAIIYAVNSLRSFVCPA
jgi:cysteine desulfurase